MLELMNKWDTYVIHHLAFSQMNKNIIFLQ